MKKRSPMFHHLQKVAFKNFGLQPATRRPGRIQLFLKVFPSPYEVHPYIHQLINQLTHPIYLFFILSFTVIHFPFIHFPFIHFPFIHFPFIPSFSFIPSFPLIHLSIINGPFEFHILQVYFYLPIQYLH
jgi:hypothetical protein